CKRISALAVSIPRREAKNLVFLLCPTILRLVSIPRREAKNGNKGKGHAGAGERFQFLVGRLKTKKAFSTVESSCMFQFLVGRLKTNPTRQKMRDTYSIIII
ncbi:MAG: hypothetical protein NUV45_15340, partial [Tepidanaerobacteraceae bacterium]|nr:hypothetical protein [Tepidanaerobacteraceae bacterium]